MATTRERYVQRCLDILEAKPIYKFGASDTNECDCIGMTKYGLHKNGVEFSTSGTNYTFRNHVTNIREIHSEKDLEVGDVVFKYRKPDDGGYNLPAKYMPGGSQYNGDLNDYYHIGTVESVNPLRIIHMTSPTAKTDTKIGKWGYCASLDSRFISDSIDHDYQAPVTNPDTETHEQTMQALSVYSENGKDVNVRVRPGLNYALVDRLSPGTVVTRIREDGAWSYIKFGSRYGWMMSNYLTEKYVPSDPDNPNEYYPGDQLTVWADNMKPVKLRQRPSVTCGIYDEVPVNEVVGLVKYGKKWSQVDYGSRKGWYMMTKFLSRG